jgi:hypothetical protein
VHLLVLSFTPVPRRKVMTENPFEIPQTLRDLSEQNLKQAHARV